MSLIVARKHKNNLIVLSDTKLTYRHEERNSPRDGTIKTIILSPDVAVSYAGDVYFAEEALKEVGDSVEVSDIESILLKYHNESRRTTDFILAVGFDNPYLIEIKDGASNQTDNSWIGSYEGFRHFQVSFLSEPNNQREGNNETTLKIVKMPDTEDDDFRATYSKMYDAMVDVIEGHEVKEVGGFVIPLIFENDEFSYQVYLRLFRKPIDIETEIPDGHWTAINFGTVEDGAYAVNFSGGNGEQLAIHFPHGNIGVLYSRDNYGLLSPTMYPEMDEIDFAEFLKDRTTISLGFSMNHGFANFAMKAQKEFSDRRYDKALTRIIQSINQASKFWGPAPDKNANFCSLQDFLDIKGKIEIPGDQVENLEKIFVLKGRIHLAIKNYEDAILGFREAITLNNTSFEGLYFKGLAQANKGDFEQAILTFSKCLDSHESAEPYYSRGAVYYHMKEYGLAQKDFEMALVVDKNHASSQQALLQIKKIQG
jgi:tetratricopeptide (TPR) repeat protein